MYRRPFQGDARAGRPILRHDRAHGKSPSVGPTICSADFGADAARIAELKLPTLIMWGGRDRLIPPGDAERFHHDIDGSRLAIFPDLGHVPQEEDPARTAAAVIDFLQARNDA